MDVGPHVIGVFHGVLNVPRHLHHSVMDLRGKRAVLPDRRQEDSDYQPKHQPRPAAGLLGPRCISALALFCYVLTRILHGLRISSQNGETSARRWPESGVSSEVFSLWHAQNVEATVDADDFSGREGA